MFIYWLKPYLGFFLATAISAGALIIALFYGFQGNWEIYQMITGIALPFSIVFWFIRSFTS
jgi:hypothetical protein